MFLFLTISPRSGLADWERLNSPILDSTQSLGTFRGVLLAGTSNGVAVSYNDGLTWNLSNGPTILGMRNFVAMDSTLFAGSLKKIYQSADTGKSWNSLDSSNYHFTSNFYARDQLIYGGMFDSGAVVSSDRGKSWTPLWRTIPQKYLRSISMKGDTVFVLASSGLYLSPDNGASWAFFDSGLTNPPQFSTLEEIVSIGTVMFLATSSGIFRLNAGSTCWEPCSSGLRWTGFYAIMTYGNVLFAGDEYERVFMTQDSGKSWIPVKSRIPDPAGWNPHIVDLLIYNNFLYAATDCDGIWRRPLSEITGVAEVKPAKRQRKEPVFALNITGISKSTLTLSYSIDTPDLVTFKLSSFSGREISLPVNRQTGTGNHIATFDLNGIANGCYLVVMNGGSKQLMRRVVIYR